MNLVSVRSVGAILSLWLLSACTAVPKGAVVFFPGPVPEETQQRTVRVPRSWHGRLIAIGDGRASFGGTETHVHSIAHTHRADVAPTADVARPLGLNDVTAGAEHTHAIQSFSTSPGLSGGASSLPLSFGVRAVVTRSDLRTVPTGMIVPFLGETIPKGFVACDGTSGTPDLSDRYLLVAERPGPAGAAKHSHSGRHTHVWTAADNGSAPAYVKDHVAPTEQVVRTTRATHLHAVAEAEPGLEATSHEAAQDPPAVSVRFIQATDRAKDLPPLTLLPFIGRTTPSGWTELRLIGGHAVLGRFLRGTGRGRTGELSGSASHDHDFLATHRVTLLPSDAKGPIDRPHDGPEVALMDHKHTATIAEPFRSGFASNAPPYVRVRFIVKTGD